MKFSPFVDMAMKLMTCVADTGSGVAGTSPRAIVEERSWAALVAWRVEATDVGGVVGQGGKEEDDVLQQDCSGRTKDRMDVGRAQL